MLQSGRPHRACARDGTHFCPAPRWPGSLFSRHSARHRHWPPAALAAAAREAPRGGAGVGGFDGTNGNDGSSNGSEGGGGSGGGAGGGTGGSGGFSGGAGGPGGTSISPNGQGGGAGGINNSGGGGGGGGYNGNGAGSPTLTIGPPLTGGNGGNGGVGGGSFGGGGGGGAGGYGAIITGVGPHSSGSLVTGGTGGNGGASVGGNAGNGGDGGVGVQFTASQTNFTNLSSITGGNGGAGGSAFTGGGGSGGGGGAGVVGAPGLSLFNRGSITGGTGGAAGIGTASVGSVGVGGAGVVGSDITIVNSGTIAGGFNGDGTIRANAITFTGGVNALELQAGSNIIGNVTAASANDILALGGTTNSSFAVSNIGASAQYQGFGIFQKLGTSTWTLTGTTAALTPWSINNGTLAISSDANLGAAAGGLTFNGGRLRTTATLTSSRAVTLNATGTFDVATGTTTLNGNIGGIGALTKTGTGTLVLGGNNNYGGATAIDAGTLVAASNNALPGQTAVSVNTGAALALADGVQVQIGSLANGSSGGGSVRLGVGDPSTTLFIAGNTATTFSGSFSGPGSLELDNGASLTLTGASNGGNIGTIGGDLTLCNCSTGGLTISGGSLTVNGLSQGVTVFGGTLTVTNGGTLQTGLDLLVAGNMIVSGAGSSVTVNGFTGVGIFGTGSVTISNGGVLNSQGGAEIDGFPFPTAPMVTVTGAGSTWNVGGIGLSVGGGSTGARGELMILDGGVVNSTASTTIGDAFLGRSRLVVSGSGSVLNAFNSLAIGETACGCDLVGTLTIADGGVVNSPGSTSIGVGSTLNLGIGGLAGAINTPAIANDGSIVANFTDTLTLGANVSGAGTLSKAGAGTLILTGTNTYSGGTTITGGTLQLGNGGTSGSLTGNVVDNGIFAINRSDTYSFGGVISGTGAFAQIGAGTTILTAINTYSGGSTINAGVLAVSADNNLGSSSGGLAFGGGTLQFLSGFTSSRTVTLNAGGGTIDTNGNNATLGGTISGSGGLTKIGTGALTLAGASSYTGATNVNAGTLQAGATNAFAPSSAFTVAGGATLNLAGFNQSIGSLAGAGNVALGAATLTTGNDNTSTTFSGTISGNGGLTKTGNGTMALTGASTYSGPTSINAGALVVNGSIANSAITIGNGATLSGTGTVGATTILSGGTFAPGNSPGTITVNGNLAFQSGAIYLVQINPSTGSSANAISGGSATLAGTVNAAFASGSYATRTYTILSAAGGLNGTTFNTLTTSNLPAGFTANLSYTANAVILGLTATLGQPTGPGALGTTGLSVNQLNVANALNGFFNNGGALPPNFVNVFGLTGGNLATALSQLSGETATGSQQVGFQLTNQFLSLMLDPFVDGRSGIAGAGGPALGFAPEQEELPQDPSSGAGVALAYAAVLKAPPKPPTFEQRWSVWGAGFGGSNRTTGDQAVVGSHDLSANVAGFAGGFDYRLTPDTVVGVAFAGAGTNWSLAQGLGTGKSDAFQAGLYGATRWGAAYVAAAFAYGNHWMSTDRFAFASDHLTADFNAQSLGGRVEGGYRLATWYGGVTPYAAIQAQSFRTPSYSEIDTTNGGFGLSYNGRTGTDTRSELGARFDRALALYSNAVLSFRGRLAWAHDWVSDPTLAAAFQTLPGASFLVNGATPAKDSVLTTAGAEYRLANGLTLLGKFDGEFASHSSTYAGTGTVRYSW
jgi:autotransporter-associated beta strand protein